MRQTCLASMRGGFSPRAACFFGLMLLLGLFFGAARGFAEIGDVGAADASDMGADSGEEESPVGYSCDPGAAPQISPLICTGAISPSASIMQFSLDWHRDPATDERVIDAISVTDRLTARPIQIIKPVESQAPMSMVANGFEFIDMNFDGYADLRLVKTMTAGANTFYSNWLWSPEKQMFLKDAALDALSSPSFDSETQEVSARNRSSASDYQRDFYAYDGPVLVLTHRELDHYDSQSQCKRTYFDRIGDDWKQTGTGACED